MCPKSWQCLYCRGPRDATYNSTITRRPQSLVRDRTLNTSGPHATETEVRGRRAILGGVLVMAAVAELHVTLDINVQGFQ